MTRRRAYTALGDTGGPGDGGNTKPPIWPPGWKWPPPPYPPGFGDGTYLGKTYDSSTYTISATFNRSVTLLVEDYDGYDQYTGSSFSITVTGGGWRALYALVGEDESLSSITSLTLSSTDLQEIYLVRLPGLQTLDVSGNEDLSSIDLSSQANLVTFDAGQCGFSGSFSMTNYLNLTTVDLADNTITSVNFSGCSSLSSLDLTSNAVTSFDLASTAFTSLDFSAFTGATTVDLEGCDLLTTLDLNALSSLSSVTLTGCTALVTLDGSSTGYTGWTLTGLSSLLDVDLSSNTLSEGQVDTILGVIEAFGTSNGTLDLCTNNPPSASGEADVTLLEGRGWTVCVDEADAPIGVYVPLNVERGTAFDLIVQGLTEAGEADTTYVPSESLTVTLNSADGSDSIDVATIDTSGWSNGSKTVSATITGGSGDDAATINVNGDGKDGDSSSFTIKDTVSGSPSLWKLTILTPFTVNVPEAGTGTCDHENCADVSHTFTGTYSGLVENKNIITSYPNTSNDPNPPNDCDQDTDASIFIRASDVWVGVDGPISGEIFNWSVVMDFDNLDKTLWATQLDIGVPRTSTMDDCMSVASVVAVLEAVS